MAANDLDADERTANIRRWLEAAVEQYGEPIQAMVVGKHYNARYGLEAADDENVVLSPEAGLAKVDQNFDNGYGGADCFPIYAWTAGRVFFVHEYDGATGLNWVPRHPMAVEPEFGGQS